MTNYHHPAKKWTGLKYTLFYSDLLTDFDSLALLIPDVKPDK